MITHDNEPLAPYTSLRVGGNAEHAILPNSYEELVTSLSETTPDWLLGFGCNVVVSDTGLAGTTILLRNGVITFDGDMVIADAGVWWDDVVAAAIDHHLWGLELMSQIPSSVGGAVFGNIAAYGQQVSDTLMWVEVYDKTTHSLEHLDKDAIQFAYRQSSLQDHDELIILRAAFHLSQQPLHTLVYDSAIAVAEEMGLDTKTLEHCRIIVIETRRRAGSLYDPIDQSAERTVGSFFKNPLVSIEQAKEFAHYDETGKTLERILNQSVIHGGNAQRASAAHVLLAAGFQRGQTWEHVRLHPHHVLKLEAMDGATAQEVYDVAHEIITTVTSRLGVTLQPEARFLGHF